MNWISPRLVLFLVFLGGSSATAVGDIPAPQPQPPRPDPVADIRLEKQVTATLADADGISVVRLPKSWLQAGDAAPRPRPGPGAMVPTLLAGLVVCGTLLAGGLNWARGQRPNATVLSLGGALAVVLLSGGVLADALPGPPPEPRAQQVAPGQMLGPLRVETLDSVDEVQLVLSREIVAGLFADAGHP